MPSSFEHTKTQPPCRGRTSHRVRRRNNERVRYQQFLELAKLREIEESRMDAEHYRVYHHVADSEYLVLREQALVTSWHAPFTFKDLCYDGWELTTRVVGLSWRGIKGKVVSTYQGVVDKVVSRVKGEIVPRVVNLVESVILLTYQLCADTTISQKLAAVAMFIKERTGSSLFSLVQDSFLTRAFNRIFNPPMDESKSGPLQQQALEISFSSAKYLLSKFKEIRKFPIWVKLHKFIMACLAFDLFKGMGLDFQKLNFTALEESTIRRQNRLDLGFVETVCDSALYICEAGWQVLKTGSFQHLYHCGSTYEQWFDTAMKLKQTSDRLGGPHVDPKEKFELIANLRDCIEKGENIEMHARRLGSSEKGRIAGMVADLRMILSDQITKQEAMKTRQAPFGILLYGNSSIGKSTFNDMLFIQYSKIFGLPNRDDYKYTRCPTDDYWSGFTSSQWCVVLDDVGFRHPAKSSDGDSSVMEVIQIVNNVPFVPPQADLADKGRTPVRCELVVGSTNQKDMNTQHYFQTPLAVNRRFPFVVTLMVKEEFAKDGIMLDSAKVAKDKTKGYPNWWNIRVERVVPNTGSAVEECCRRGIYELVEEFKEINDFMVWFSREAKAHKERQNAVQRSNTAMRAIEICKVCCRPLVDGAKCCEIETFDPVVDADPVLVDTPTVEVVEDLISFDDVPTPVVEQMSTDEWLEFPCPKKTCVVKSMPEQELNSLIEKIEGFLPVSYGAEGPHLDYFYNDLFTALKICHPTLYLWVMLQKVHTLRDLLTVLYRVKSIGDDYDETNDVVIADVSIPYGWHDAFHDSWSLVRATGCYGFNVAAARIEGLTPYSRAAVAKYSALAHRVGMAKYRATLYARKTYADVRKKMGELGDRVEANIGMRPGALANLAKKMLIAGATIVGVVMTTTLVMSLLKSEKTVEQGTVTSTVQEVLKPQEASPSPDLDRDLFKRGSQLEPRDGVPEKENVWKKEKFEMSTFDVSTASACSMNNFAAVRDMVQKNCVRLRYIIDEDGMTKQCFQSAFCLGGHLFVTPAHFFHEDKEMELEVLTSNDHVGVTPNIKTTIRRSAMYIDVPHDLAYFQVDNMPPMKDLTKYLPHASMQGTWKGEILGLDYDLSVRHQTVANVRLMDCQVNTAHGVVVRHIWGAQANEATIVGDCGRPWLLDTAKGPVLAAIHGSGLGKFAGGNIITIEGVEAVRKHFEIHALVSSGKPNLSAPGAERVLTELHAKSPVRFITEGSARVYGSFLGHRSNSKSRVRSTVMSDYYLKKYGECAFGAPVLNGWKPWHIALKDMVNIPAKMNKNILKGCTKAFTEDIISGLTPEDLNEIRVLDLFTAVNGAEGVQFVDSINRSTSMGAPWNKSKKHFLQPVAARGGLTEPVMFDDNVLNRVEEILQCYEKGERWMPVFTAHLKDEALKQSKIDACKTRVFAGSPADWATVVRMYTLSFTRCLQRNRFLFEAGPGTNATSTQWEGIYQYLTAFGDDRMIAGDFGHYDKTLEAALMLAAFNIIFSVCKKAGYSSTELLVLNCIAEDTTFPLVDFHGDLMEFFGQNPSGQPLTVIINSLCNALYMRYCYTVTKVCSERGISFDRMSELDLSVEAVVEIARYFKQHVHLMTYGDDNIMGVNPKCTWFTHCGIQNVLANLGVEYTMADKESVSVPFIGIDECSFLKRSWSWSDYMKVHLAPLDEKSILKSLCISVESKSMCREAQAVAIMSSACQEYFQYGEKVFQDRRQELLNVVEEYNLGDYVSENTFPTFAQLEKRYWDNSA